ncbi:serpin family protein [Synechococcus sp. R55.2]
MDQFNLVADRPFLFAIVHQPTGVVLFLGVVRQPGA